MKKKGPFLTVEATTKATARQSTNGRGFRLNLDSLQLSPSQYFINFPCRDGGDLDEARGRSAVIHGVSHHFVKLGKKTF